MRSQTACWCGSLYNCPRSRLYTIAYSKKMHTHNRSGLTGFCPKETYIRQTFSRSRCAGEVDHHRHWRFEVMVRQELSLLWR